MPALASPADGATLVLAPGALAALAPATRFAFELAATAAAGGGGGATARVELVLNAAPAGGGCAAAPHAGGAALATRYALEASAAWAEVRTHGEVAPARAWHRCAVEDDGRGGMLVFGGGGKDGAQKGVWSLRGLAVG